LRYSTDDELWLTHATRSIEMSTSQRRSVWFARAVLTAATLLLTRISAEYIINPVAAVAPHQITLGSPEAITMMRVSGGMFLGIAITLLVCLTSSRRLLAGLGFLAVVATVILATRLVGLAVDGSAPFTLEVLKPEVVLVVLSSLAFFLERRRRASANFSGSLIEGNRPRVEQN
jgi:uncharacterized protein DUF4345